jgi:hypothetical protein
MKRKTGGQMTKDSKNNHPMGEENEPEEFDLI